MDYVSLLLLILILGQFSTCLNEIIQCNFNNFGWVIEDWLGWCHLRDETLLGCTHKTYLVSGGIWGVLHSSYLRVWCKSLFVASSGMDNIFWQEWNINFYVVFVVVQQSMNVLWILVKSCNTNPHVWPIKNAHFAQTNQLGGYVTIIQVNHTHN